jgi:uncharacterized phage-associated protein
MVYSVSTVTDTLLDRSRLRELQVSNLMLQKLLYYSQAWHLVLANKALFDDEVEAWVHGPVVPSVFRRFKQFKWDPITEQISVCNDRYLVTYLDSVLQKYGKYSAKQLERLTHSEAPWCEARVGIAPDEPSNKVISKDAMYRYFKGLIQANA